MAPLVDELIDGTLDERRASAVRGHLRACTACGARYEATRGLAEQLGALEPHDPPPTLWARIDARLAEDEVADGRRPRWWWWWQAWRRPLAYSGALAAAGMVAVGVYALKRPANDAPPAVVVRDSDAKLTPPAPQPPAQPPVPAPPPEIMGSAYDEALKRLETVDREYTAAVGELKEIVKAERPRWRPEVAQAFDANLATIDTAIEHQRAAARRQPGDPAAIEALHDGYDKQIGFLQEAVVRGEVAR